MSDTIIVCPDCGQSFDPTIERAEFQSSRGTKMKTRVGAQAGLSPDAPSEQTPTLRGLL